MKLIPQPSYYLKLRQGGLISKYQTGGPVFFKQYGMNPNKFISMFDSLRSRGLSNQVAFEITWQSMKEVPKSFYSFGTKFGNVNSWADDIVNHQLKREIYKDAINAQNFQEYRKATLPYNKRPGYTEWLLKGRDQGKQFINEYIKENNLGKPVVMNNVEPNPNDNYYT